MENHNLFNRKILRFFRSSLRNKSTSAEVELWNMLKSRKLDSKRFRRQHSIDNYIVDFFCASEKLIIELDGNPHGEYHRIEKDIKRDQDLKVLGFSILRFENRLVFQEPEFVKNEIRKNFKNKEPDLELTINHPGRNLNLYYNLEVVRPPLLQKEGKFIVHIIRTPLERCCRETLR